MITHLRRLAHIAADRSGVAALEFAVIATVAVTVMLAAIDVSTGVQQQMALDAALRAGAAYAAYFPEDSSGIQTAITRAMPTGLSLSGTPTLACSCTGVTGTFSCSAPPSTCAPPLNMTLSASMGYTSVSALFKNWITGNSASYVVRLQ